MAEFKDRILELRKKQKNNDDKEWSQSFLASKLAGQMGIKDVFSKQTISQYERGARTPTVETVIALSRIFNVSTDYLLGLSDHIKQEYTPINEQTGLSDMAIQNIQKFKNSKDYCGAIKALNQMLEADFLGTAYDIFELREIMDAINAHRTRLSEEEQYLDKIINRAANYANSKRSIRKSNEATISGEVYVDFRIQEIIKSLSNGITQSIKGQGTKINY